MDVRKCVFRKKKLPDFRRNLQLDVYKRQEQNRLLNMIQNQTAGQLELLSQFMNELERTESREQYCLLYTSRCV